MTVESLIEKTVCVICSKTFQGIGHNPAPIKFSGRCCNDCNDKVIYSRLEKLISGAKNDQAIIKRSRACNGMFSYYYFLYIVCTVESHTIRFI